MKRFSMKSLALAGALTAVGLMAGAGMTFAQEVTLRLHQFLPAQANVPKFVLDPWADKVEKDSGGRIKIERYPAMQLGGKPPELMDQAIDGTVDIVWTLPGSTPGRFPSTEVFELPFMMTNAEATSRAYWDIFNSKMKDTEFKDVHIIAAWVHGPGLIHSREPIAKLDDMKGKKLRAPTRIVNALLGQLGATPVGMPVPAITENLSKGVIDGAVIPWEVTTALKVAELVQNHTEFGGDHALYTTTFVLAMNKARYDALPDDLKKVIDDNSGADVSALFGKTQAGTDAAGRKVAVDAGNNIIELSATDVEPWKTAAQPVMDNWVVEMQGKGVDGQALLDEARTLIDKYTQK
ncbi:TRAP-type C4-dicarboxylate transport system, substrate-binding protein [Mesorhizobium albiziae]|uniref:TRAP-type C4-dicarboxylate transport system, substrate-binding protein n=1 Tax=Neomesorhizobium albiziae TaxID=335020 RepID=A0A1I4B1C1_9HYPH|nr:TRAP transporter substrate-binding protein [Mesorhizobium albiziae]GLS34207.1 C4-dicarboxylate ABC transporter [Mesorhizobium albiziae]SFK61957.1 TRAP-type C4-dicarboxylate transport system, substrate-binding protein [Mesorhizobium albiziae]